MTNTCNCFTQKGELCKKPITYIYEFSNSQNLIYSCNIPSHRIQIIKQLSLEHTMNIYSHNMYHMLYNEISCFDCVFLFDDTFYQPHPKEYTLWIEYKKLKKDYKKRKLFMKLEFSDKKMEDARSSRQTLIKDMNEILTPEKNNQQHINHMLCCLTLANNLINQYCMYEKQFTRLKSEYKSLRTIYNQVFRKICLPWNNEEYHECCICISAASEIDAGHLECGHVFHNYCIQQWIETSHLNCPMCRYEFNRSTLVIRRCEPVVKPFEPRRKL